MATEKKYSKNPFDGYKFRAKVEVTFTRYASSSIDVYTDDCNRNNVESILRNRMSNEMESLNIIHWSSKERDEAQSKFLNKIHNQEE
jgi:hypothetical protein